MPIDPTDYAAINPLRRSLGAVDLAANAPLSPSTNAVDLAAATQAFPVPQDQPIRPLPAAELPALYGSEFTRGLRRGALGALGSIQGAAAQAVEPFSAKLADEYFAEANKTLNFGRELQPGVESWKDVHGPSDFLSYGLGKAGEALPSTLASLAAAGVGGAAGLGLRALTGARVPLGFAAGAGSMFPQEAGEAALTMRNDPAAMARTTPWERVGLAGGKGAINAALEFAPEAIALRRAFGAPGIRRGFVPALGEIGKGAAEAAAGEAATEALQEKTGQIFHGFANPLRDPAQDIENIKEAALGGAFGGVGFGGAGGLTHAVRSNVPEMPALPTLPTTPEAQMEAGYKTAEFLDKSYQRAADGLSRFVTEMGRSTDKNVRASLQWSQDKENKLQLLLAHPEHGEDLAKLPEESQRAIIETLDVFQKGPGEAKKRHAAAYEHLRTLVGDRPEDLTLGLETDYAEFDYTGKRHPTKEGMVRFEDLQEPNFEDQTQLTERGDAAEMEKPLQPPLNSEILSNSLTKTGFFKAPVLGRPQKHLTIRLQSDEMSPQEIVDALHTEGRVKGTARKNFAELHISPFSLANEIAKNPATKETLPDIREGQTGTSDAHKADTIITALSTLMNNGLTVNGKKVNVKVPEVPRNLLLGQNVEPYYTVAQHLNEQTLATTKPRAQLDTERRTAELALERSATKEDITRGLARLDAQRQAAPAGPERENLNARYNALKDFDEQVTAQKERMKKWNLGDMPQEKVDALAVSKAAEFALKRNTHYTAIDNLTTLAETAKEEIHNNPGGESIALAQDLRSFIESSGEIATERVKKLLKASGASSLRDEGVLTSEYMYKHKNRVLGMLENLEQQAELAALSGVRPEGEVADIEGSKVPNIRKEVYGAGANLPPIKLGKKPAPAVLEKFRPQAKKYPPGPMSPETAALEAEARAERRAIQSVEAAEKVTPESELPNVFPATDKEGRINLTQEEANASLEPKTKRVTPEPGEPPTRTIQMYYKDGERNHTMRPEFRGKSTLDLIKSGDRTATTRTSKPNVKVGEVLRAVDKEGNAVNIRVTKEPYEVSTITPAQWSQLEGWSEKDYSKYKVNGWQFTYEKVEPKPVQQTLQSEKTEPTKYAKTETTLQAITKQQEDAITFLGKQAKEGNFDTKKTRALVESLPATSAIQKAEKEKTLAVMGELEDLAAGKYDRKGLAQLTVNGWAKKFADGKSIRIAQLPKDSIFAKAKAAASGGELGGLYVRINGQDLIVTFEGGVQSSLSSLGRLAHEFGHALEKIVFQQAPKDVQNKLFAQYKKDLTELAVDPAAIERFISPARLFSEKDVSEVLGGVRAVDAETMLKAIHTAIGTELESPRKATERKYIIGFDEWFAEQFSKYVTSKGTSEVDPTLISFWDKVVAKFREFFNEVIQRYKPNETFEHWVDSLVTPRPEIKPSQQTIATPGAEPGSAANLAQMQAIAKKMFGEKVEVVVGVPKGEEESSARGWYLGRKQLDEYKATEAKVEQIRKDRREALTNKDQALADSLLDSEAKLQKQLQVVGTIYMAPHLANAEMLPTFYHEAVHAAFDILLTPQERATLGTAFSRGLVRRRLEELFKGDPAVLAQMQEAEEAAAYGFQIYAVAPHLIDLGPQTKTIFDKVKTWFRKMLNILTPEEKATVIMNQMLSGVRAETGVSPLQRLLDRDAPLKDRVLVHIKALTDIVQKFWEVMATPTYDRLLSYNNPALEQLARLGYTKTGEKGQLGMIQKMQTEITSRLNWIDKFTRKYTPEELAAAADARLLGKEPAAGKVTQAYNDLQTFFDDFHAYSTKAKVAINYQKNYWPMLWDAEKVMKGREAFLKMLAKPEYKEHMDKLKVTPTELWENISGYVTRGESFQGVLGKSGEPINAYAKEKSLSFLDPTDRKPFMNENPLQVMTNYVTQMTRQAEFVRSYGQGGETKTQLLKDAEHKYGATKDQLARANDYMDALLGNKEIGMSRELKDIYGAAVVYQNYRLLPYSFFTSLVDPVGIAVRSNNIGDAFEAFAYSMKNVFRDLKKTKPDTDKDYWQKLAEDWGYIEDAGTMSNLRHMAETTELRGFSKKMNDALFKWNLLNGWTRSTKIMAVKAAQRFFLRSAEGTDALSIRNLEEVGLKKSDIIPDGQGGIALRKDELMALGVSEAQATEIEARLQDATTKFVNQAILNPTAADLPNWGSNPYLAPIFHLKQFMFTFQNVILSRIMKEAGEGNFKPLWIAGIYVPGMIGADFLRGMISNFGDIPKYQQDWGVTDYVANGVARSGLIGTGQMLMSVKDDVAHGGKGYESAIGPTLEQLKKGLSAASKGDMAMWNFIVKAMPLNPIYDQWILSKQ